eukprot:403341847
MYLKSSKFPSLTNESPHEHDLKHRQSLQRESSDYLKSIKAGLDLGILRQIPITKEVINDQRLQKDLFQGQNGQSYFSGSSGIQNQSDRDSMTNSLLNAASYTMRGVRAPPQEQGYENYQTLQNQVKGKISGFYTQRPSLYGESNISKVQGIEMPLKEVKYKDTYFQGTAEHLLASNPRMIINKDYEKPRYGDAQASFRHPTYLPNHQPREEFLKSVSYEAEKGFQTMRKSDSYREQLDSMQKKITIDPQNLQKFHKPFQWEEIPRQNPQLHYKNPLISRRLNINHVKYDDQYYQKPSPFLNSTVIQQVQKNQVMNSAQFSNDIGSNYPISSKIMKIRKIKNKKSDYLPQGDILISRELSLLR